MSNTQLNEVSALVATLAPAQDGGMGTITVSVVAVIIILLVLILVT